MKLLGQIALRGQALTGRPRAIDNQRFNLTDNNIGQLRMLNTANVAHCYSITSLFPSLAIWSYQLTLAVIINKNKLGGYTRKLINWYYHLRKRFIPPNQKWSLKR